MGTLKKGARGDVAVFRMREGKFVFEDSLGAQRKGNQMLEATHVVLGGRLLRPSGAGRRKLTEVVEKPK